MTDGWNGPLAQAIRDLRDAGIADPARDARLLLASAMGVAADRLTLHLADTPTDAAVLQFARLILRRIAREPVSHLIGHRMFWGRAFRVTADVLDPRPETECLLAEALTQPFSRVLDLGTGSGCIVLSLLADRSDATGIGSDASPAALEIARENARIIGLGARVDFVASHWFDGIDGTFDLIVSNPPYIGADEMADLAPEVLNWEPHAALTPGGDGLDAYRAITRQATSYLAPQGRLIMEIGPTQANAVMALCRGGGLIGAHVLQDMDGRDRVITARKPEVLRGIGHICGS